jgi:ubiquinone/menaquinone biosynthesis C-methylase UbiE
MMPGLPQEPLILDVGCGPGMQTMDLLTLTRGMITAVDNYQPFLDELERRAVQKNFSHRVQTVNQDMGSMNFEPESFDVIWSEGAIYLMGFENGLKSWKRFLKKEGYIAVSEISWLKPFSPDNLRAFWEAEYPAICDIDENLNIIRESGYRDIKHFTLPETAWWESYYAPLENRLPGFIEKYKGDDQAQAVIQMIQAEIDLYKTYSEYYGYIFYVMRNA